MLFDHSVGQLLEDPVEYFWDHGDPEHYHDHLGPRARDATVRFSQAGPKALVEGHKRLAHVPQLRVKPS